MKRALVWVSILWAGAGMGAGCALEEGSDEGPIAGERAERGAGAEAPRLRCEQVFTCARDGVSFVGEVFGGAALTPAEARLECRAHCGQGCEASGLGCIAQPEK